MNGRRTLALPLLATAFLSLGAGSGEPPRCEDRSWVLDKILFAPWPEIEYTWAGQVPITLALPRRGSMEERDILEYFTASEKTLPKVESKVLFGNREPGYRTSLRRTWRFDGLTIDALIAVNRGVYYESIVLETSRYPLICGLGVGVSVDKVRSLLGKPTRASDAAPGKPVRSLTYEDVGDMAVYTDFEVTFHLAESGAVERIVWKMPVGH